MKLRIAIVVENFPTLSETFIINKVLHLCSRGHQVTVFTHRRTKDEGLMKLYGFKQISHLTIVPPAIPSNAVDWLKLALRKPSVFAGSGLNGKSFKTASRDKLLLASLQSKPFDIIHFEFSALAILYKNIIPKLKAKVVVSCRGTAEKVKPFTVPGRAQQLAGVFDAVHAIHCVSADMSATVQALGASPQKIFVNRPSIDIAFFNGGVQRQPTAHLNIVSVGRFTFQKGYLLGLMAVRQLQQQGIAFTWRIVGDGPQMEEMMFHLHTMGLTEQVQLLGKKNKEEILELYQQADVLLLPSVYEGIANVVLEAMAMRLPVVSTKSGGLEEVIEHGKNGLLTNVYDHAAMAAQLALLAGDAVKRQQLGEHARRTIEQSFTIQRQIDEFETRYHALVAPKTVIA